jgi:uncharacterized protein involved in exopolysaccharide biosynthesis
MSDDKAYFDSSNFIVFTYKYRKVIGTIVIVAFVVSAIISYIIPEKYQSVAKVYPSNTNSIAQAIISNSPGNQNDIMEFGEEEKTEQLLEVLESEKVKSKIITEFNLLKHYQVDSTQSSTPITDLHEKYKNNISFKRNVNMAVEIAVLDINPDTASLIANRIVSVADEVMNEIRQKRNKQAFQIVKKIYLDKVSQIGVMEDSIKFIMKNGVIDVSGQTEVYSNAHAIALSKGNKTGAQALEKKLNVISKYGAQLISLNENLVLEQKVLSELQAKYTEAKIDVEEKIENLFIVNRAFPAEKNSYPVRWLIVLLSTIGSLVIGILAITVFEQLQKLKFEIESTID